MPVFPVPLSQTFHIPTLHAVPAKYTKPLSLGPGGDHHGSLLGFCVKCLGFLVEGQFICLLIQSTHR